MSEWNYVGAAYGLTWLALVGYISLLVVKSRQIKRRLENSSRFPEVDR